MRNAHLVLVFLLVKMLLASQDTERDSKRRQTYANSWSAVHRIPNEGPHLKEIHYRKDVACLLPIKRKEDVVVKKTREGGRRKVSDVRKILASVMNNLVRRYCTSLRYFLVHELGYLELHQVPYVWGAQDAAVGASHMQISKKGPATKTSSWRTQRGFNESTLHSSQSTTSSQLDTHCLQRHAGWPDYFTTLQIEKRSNR